MAQEKESKYQRCDECHGGYLIVFECKDNKKRCARCKETYDRNEREMREEIVERAGVPYANQGGSGGNISNNSGHGLNGPLRPKAR